MAGIHNARQLLDRPRQTLTDLDRNTPDSMRRPVKCLARQLDRPRQTSTDLDTESQKLDSFSTARELDRPAHGVSLDGARQELESSRQARQGSTGKASTTASTAARRSLDSSTARQFDSQGSTLDITAEVLISLMILIDM